MTGNGTLQRLTDRIEALQREKRELARQIQGQEELVSRHQRLLDELQRGVFAGRRRGRFLVWSSLALLVVAGLGAYVWYSVRVNRPDTSRLGLPTERLMPLTPHLLVTSDPGRAAVFVDGKAEGKTPVLLGSRSRSASYQVRVQAAGYRPMVRTLTVTPAGGVHWHAVFSRAPGPASQEMQR
jgi:hypothetical protein